MSNNPLLSYLKLTSWWPYYQLQHEATVTQNNRLYPAIQLISGGFTHSKYPVLTIKTQMVKLKLLSFHQPVTLVLGLILGLAGELTADFPRPLPLFVFFSSVSSSKSLSSPSLALSSLLNSSLSSKSLS